MTAKSAFVLPRSFTKPAKGTPQKSQLPKLYHSPAAGSVPHRVRYPFSLRFASSDTTNKNLNEKYTRESARRKKQDEETNQKLSEEFDDLAEKEGFDSSTARLAVHSTFEDKFDQDDEFLDDDDDDSRFDAVLDSDDPSNGFSSSESGEGDDIDRRMAEARAKMAKNWDVNGEISNDEDDNEFTTLTIDKPPAGLTLDNDDDDGDYDDEMERRIAEARGHAIKSEPVSDEMVSFAMRQAKKTYEELGIKQEVNPYGDGEIPNKHSFHLITNAMTCSACGSDFQCTNEGRPGYLPAAKFEIQTKLAKIEEMQRLQQKAESNEWTVRDEIEYLIQTSDGTAAKLDDDGVAAVDIDLMAKELGLDLEELSKKKTICRRCHGLQNQGTVEDVLRPGWTDEPTLSQQQFRALLRPISEKKAIVIAIIDLFDFSGSVLRELDGIAGENPVILAANKVDLLPQKMGKLRVENWVRRELEYMGVKSIANMGGAVRLVSCRTGQGIPELMEKVRKLADKMDCDVYVVGAANAGKSTFINHLLGKTTVRPIGKIRAGNKNAFKGALTTSPLPGTTLKFIKIDIGDGKSLYDTPGLLVPGTMTQFLTPKELKIVCPKKPVEPITFRISAGKSLLIGGLARIDVIGDSKPFLFTIYVANEIKLHLTDASKVDDFIRKHIGTILTPPLPPGEQRLEELGEFDSHILDIQGDGWKEASADIALTGLGWVAVSGVGTVKVKVSVPKGIGVSVRPPLMPFDIWDVASKYTGTKAVRRAGRSKSGKKRSGVGRN